MEKISLFNRSFIFLGKRIGETQRMIINNLGVAFVSPLGMILSTKITFNQSPEQINRHKTEVKYQALRNPLSAVVGFLGTYAVYQPFIKKMNRLALEGKLPDYMHSLITFDTQKHEAASVILQGLKQPSLSQPLQNQITDSFQLAQKLHQLEESKVISAEEPILRNTISNNIRKIWDSTELTSTQKNAFKKFFKVVPRREFEAYRQVHQTILYLMVTPVTMTLLNWIFPPFVQYFFPSIDKAVREIK